MLRENSPLEHLTAFAIVFAASVISTICLGQYLGKVKRDAIRSYNSDTTN